jgi:hypothetical protein
MPQEPGARRETISGLNDWQLQPHNTHLQVFVVRKVLPSMKEAAGVTDCALQFKADGQRKILLWVGDKVHTFDTGTEAADWLASEQKRREESQKRQSA